MGARVAEADDQPDYYRVGRCPTCGGKLVSVDGAWLKWKRQRARLSQRTFGDRVGVSSPYLSDIESNRRECPPSILEAYRKLKGTR